MNEILFKTGEVVSVDVVRGFFERVFAAEASGTLFPCDLDVFWPMAYTQKGHAIRSIERQGFIEGEDFIRILSQNGKNSGRGQPIQQIMMTVQCTEHLVARKVKTIFEIYRQCRIALTNKCVSSIPQTHPWAVRFQKSYRAHMKYVRSHYRTGDWSIVLAKLGDFLSLEDVLAEHQFQLLASDRPDGSVGSCWSRWIRDQEPIGDAPLYLPDHNITVLVKVYPASCRQDFEEWYEGNYIRNKLRPYMQGKFKRRYGEIPTDSATHHFALNVTGHTCPAIPAKNLRAIQHNGGIVKAGQVLIGPDQKQKSLGFS